MAKKTQIQNFRDTARALETDESEERFNEALRKVGKAKRGPDKLADLIKSDDPEKFDEIAREIGNKDK